MREFPSQEMKTLREGFLAEYTSGLGQSYAMHQRGGKKQAGEFVERVSRIINDKHVTWEFDRDPQTLQLRRRPDGKPIRRKTIWLQPYHEAVKRLAPSVTDEARLSERDRKERLGQRQRHSWLRDWILLSDRPCSCGHQDVIGHIAGTTPHHEVRRALQRAAREALNAIPSSDQ